MLTVELLRSDVRVAEGSRISMVNRPEESLGPDRTLR
jgi:hypothetical protein